MVDKKVVFSAVFMSVIIVGGYLFWQKDRFSKQPPPPAVEEELKSALQSFVEKKSQLKRLKDRLKISEGILLHSPQNQALRDEVESLRRQIRTLEGETGAAPSHPPK